MKNIDLFQELRSYHELNIYQMSKSIGRYASYNVEIVDSKHPLVWLEASKSSIIYFLKTFLDEIISYKNQITVKFLLRNDKQNRDKEFACIYFIFTTKTVINLNMTLTNYFYNFCTGLIIGLMKDLVG